jgi:putative oxidoreductase
MNALFKTILRCLIAILLIGAAVTKIANLNDFYLSITLYQLPLADGLIRLTAMVLPWLEFLCGILLIAGTAKRAALLWAIILFAIFVLVTGQAWLRGLNISCGCFKLQFLGETIGAFLESVKFAFLRAVLLLAAAIYLFRDREPAPSVSTRR